MRRILVSHARARRAEKRGGGGPRLTLGEELALSPQREVNLLALDEALTKLETIDPEKSRMVELRFFSGLSVEETAEVLSVSARTVDGSGWSGWHRSSAGRGRQTPEGKED